MTEREQTQDVVEKMVKGLVSSGGPSFALGYLQTFMANVIDRNVTDKAKLETLRIEMLGIGINYLLDAKQ
jgi:hypothetical protein